MIDSAFIQRVREYVSALEADLATPEVASDHRRFTKMMTEHAHQKALLTKAERFESLKATIAEAQELLQESDVDDDMAELARLELTQAQEALPAAEKAMMIALLPPDPQEERGTICEIRAGTGGEEAALFAGDLYRMYTRFADSRGWKTTIMDASQGTVGGYKEIIFSIEGQGVFRELQYESGVHRVQRVPATEAQGRIHTSAATVAVLPEADEVDEIDLKPDEIRIDIFRSSGPGGQSVNTTDSAVRIIHLATGIVVQCQDEKSQHRNREKAMRVLKARILDRLRSAEAEKTASKRRSLIGSGDRSERIRTYNFPQNRLTDHRIGLTLYSLDRVMEGDLNDLLEALYNNDLELRIREQTSGE